MKSLSDKGVRNAPYSVVARTQMRRCCKAALLRICRLQLLLIAILNVLMPSQLQAQFQLHQWISFESGSLENSGFTIGSDPASTIEVVDLSKTTGMPAAFYNEEVSKELGRYALKLRANPPGLKGVATPSGFGSLKEINHKIIDPNGSILYQADIFIPDTQHLPNVALLAMTFPPKEKAALTSTISSIGAASYYRWGITVNKTPYFSYTEPGKPRPIQYLHDRDLIPLLPKGRWHRFAILVKWRSISCYIDGRGTIFSPNENEWIVASNVNTYLAGVLLAESKHSYDCYIDNISVQVSSEQLRVPDSPYEAGWQIPPGLAARDGAKSPDAWAKRDLRWLEPGAAWQKARTTGKPFLIFFCSPGLPNSDRVEKMLANDEQAKQFLEYHVPTRVDVNQLKGSEIAQQYKVFKVPAIIVLSPDGKTYRRSIPGGSDEWPAIGEALKLP